MNKSFRILISIAFYVLILLPVYGQDRQSVDKYSYSFYSVPVSKFMKWSKNGRTGEWHSEQPDKYKGPKEDSYKGAINWDIVSFKNEDQDVYAIRYKVGSYNFKYPSLELEPYWTSDYIYYFITYHDVLKLQNISENQVVKIYPYGKYLYNFGADALIRTFIKHEYSDVSNEIILCKYTYQNQKPVIRFTLPYEGYYGESVFENGPYYEIPFKAFSGFQKSLSNIPYQNEYKPSKKKSKLFDQLANIPANEAKAQYDTTSWYLDVFTLAKDNHYYDGQRVMFLPYRTNKGEKPYQYLGGFSSPQKVSFPELADTVWVIGKKGTRTSHVNIPETDVYKAEFVRNKKVRYYSSTRIGTDNLKFETGFATPISCIEGKYFTIQSAITQKKYEDYDVLLELIDDEGQKLYFSFTFYSFQNRDGFMPFLLEAMWNKTEQLYRNKEFLPKDRYGDYSYVRRSVDSDTYSIIKGELSFLDISLKNSSNHHDYVSTSSNNSLSYGIYYDEPVLHLIDNNKMKYEFPITTVEKRNSSDVFWNYIPEGNPSITYYYLLLDNLQEVGQYKLAKEREKQQELAKEKKRQERIQALSQKYGKNTAEEIANGYVRVGWSQEKCLESWGKPEQINKTIGIWGVHEQWVYSIDCYLYFEDGVLTAIQN